ncbi:MAG: DoxX family membrane protein [Saprospiraceae bacterium]|nr:DoxX family membrane protein [Saprospiraceae bacterium]
MKDIVDLIGRILIALIFIYEGMDSMLYYQKNRETMVDYGLTFQTDLLLIIGIFILLLGGTLLLLGYRSSLGSILLLLYWIPFTFIVYDFWNDAAEDRRVQAILFMRNLAIVGGLLMIFVNGSGKYSVKTLLANTKVPKRFR